jgi:hypothetical protein
MRPVQPTLPVLPHQLARTTAATTSNYTAFANSRATGTWSGATTKAAPMNGSTSLAWVSSLFRFLICALVVEARAEIVLTHDAFVCFALCVLSDFSGLKKHPKGDWVCDECKSKMEA